jgi:hypothetical protein
MEDMRRGVGRFCLAQIWKCCADRITRTMRIFLGPLDSLQCKICRLNVSSCYKYHNLQATLRVLKVSLYRIKGIAIVKDALWNRLKGIIFACFGIIEQFDFRLLSCVIDGLDTPLELESNRLIVNDEYAVPRANLSSMCSNSSSSLRGNDHRSAFL